MPVTVDVNVMSSFSEFYIHLLGFVNYKLYSDAGLSYPPLVCIFHVIILLVALRY